MSDIVIQVNHVWKKYRLGVLGTGTLRHDFNRWLHRICGRPDPYAVVGKRDLEPARQPDLNGIPAVSSPAAKSPVPLDQDEIWAVRDLNFEVRRGEILGIIGRNGAGKSTLLKILSRVTTPTNGEVRVKGRIASLLEVGTGFHPELTGRENIFLNGAILGMNKLEIRKKFDEIVAFSEVENFIDTPVKRYSSGMYVRLAFAVAAHLEPEILIIDEVLAVGDAQFQKKCLGKMEEVSRGGRTVLFVSHNMGVVSDLCGKCLMLRSGTLVTQGESPTVVSQFLASGAAYGSIDLSAWSVERSGDGPMRVLSISTLGADHNVKGQFTYKESILFNLSLHSDRERECILGLAIRNANGQCILHLNNTDDGASLIVPEGDSQVQVLIQENILNDDRYYVTVWLGDAMNVLHDRVGNCLSFLVCSTMHGSVRSQGSVRQAAQWKIKSKLSIHRKAANRL